MKKTVIVIVLGLVLTGLALGGLFLNQDQAPNHALALSQVNDAYQLLRQTLLDSPVTYLDYLKSKGHENGKGKYSITLEAPISLAYEEGADFDVEVATSGYYEIHLVYDLDERAVNSSTLALSLNGQVPFEEAKTLNLPTLWQDVSKTYSLDSYGDEALPQQTRVEGPYETGLYNNRYTTVAPLKFYFDQGLNTLTIENVSSGGVTIQELIVAAPTEVSPYKDQSITPGQLPDQVVNATDYVSKNSSYVRVFSHQTPTVSPFDPINRKLNVIAGQSWDTPGQTLSYTLDVPETGHYYLSFHHMPGKDDFHVFRTLRIDGQIPFEGMAAYAFKDTKASNYLYETLADNQGQPYVFYLEKGKHELTLTADVEPLAHAIDTLQLIVDHINEFSLDIRKITGKEVDKKRTWRITEYLPETQAYLEAYDTLIEQVISDTAQYAPNGQASSSLSYLTKARVKLAQMLEDPDELPLYFEDLYSGSGSVNQMLGDTIEAFMDQPLTLNEIRLHQNLDDYKSNASFIQKQWADFNAFVASFTSDKYKVRNEEGVLNVWINRQITHVDTLQKLVDAEFTPRTGIKVKLSVMPDPNKLILATAGGEAPDVAMGLLSYMPFDLAIRDAAYDLTEFDDFWQVANRFTPGALVPYVLEDGVYGYPETLEFFATLYRKDIFDNLNLEVPDTWQEVTELLPELQRFGMNFYHPIAGGGSIKWFYQTSPFIYQHGGALYTPDGLSAAIDQPQAVEGIETLNKLFTTYALPEQEPLFYNAFRYGTLPVGIADFTTYMQIKNAAPELIGKWDLAPYPAVIDHQGQANRSYIANGRGSVIMKTTDMPEASWEFLKWWSSQEVQTTYGYTLQSIYGPEYLWLSANLDAVKESPLDIKDKAVILEQVKWLKDVPRTPGQYMLERGLSDIWNKAVYNGLPTRVAIDQQVIIINREIKRKMIEFGYLDSQGQVIKPYIIRDVDWIEEQMNKGGQSE